MTNRNDFTIPYRQNLQVETHDLPPGVAEHVRQVEDEVEEAPTRSGQVGFGEEDADEEALSDSGEAEDQQEDEDHRGVAVLEHLTVLRQGDISEAHLVFLYILSGTE